MLIWYGKKQWAMAWSKNGILISIVLVFGCHLSQGQDKSQNDNFINNGLGVKIQTIISYPYDNDIGTRNYASQYEMDIKTFIVGFHVESNYYFTPYFGVGIGGGFEKITQPSINYFPLYLNLIGILSEEKSTWYAKLNFGSHLGTDTKRGFIFRGGLGCRLKVYKNILSYIELTYTFQNLYKKFKQTTRPYHYYNIESLGITLGIGLN